MKTEKYRLYIGTLTEANINIALNEAYSRATRTHVLIYKKGKAPDGFKEITDVDVFRLPASDQKWLQEVNVEIMRLFLKQHAEEERKAERKFLTEFEKELAKEREKLAQQARDGDSE